MKSKTQDLFALTAISLMTTASVSAAPTVIGLKAQNGDVLCIQNDYQLTGDYDIGLYAKGGEISFSGSNMLINTLPGTGWGGGNVGVYAAASGAERSVVRLGEKNSTQRISINVRDDSEKPDVVAIGLWAKGDTDNPDYHGGLIEVNSETLEVQGYSEAGWVYGIYAQNATTNATGEKATIVINADNTVVNVGSGVEGTASGIVAMSQGVVEINGNLSVVGDNVILARGNSVVKINKDRTATVRLDGNIDFNFDKATSGTTADSEVSVYLSGKDSYWVGTPVVSYGTGEPPEGFDQVSGMEIGLINGAVWQPVVVSANQTPESGVNVLAVNTLEMEGGVIALSEDLVKAGQAVSLKNVVGTGGTIRTYVMQNDDGIRVGEVNVDSLQMKGALSVVADNMTADDVSDAEGTLSTLAHVVNVQQSQEDAQIKAVVPEGDILGELTQTFDAQGTAQGSVEHKENAKLSSFASVNVINLMQWRHETNDLNERMGELRMSPEGMGSWVRLYGSSQTYGATGTETKNTSIQLGIDQDAGADWKVGAAFSYTDSSSSMNIGSAEGDVYGLALYGTWLHNDGQFVDLIAKYSRITTDFVADAMQGDYDNNAWSLSAEYGRHFKLSDVGFLEPQLEVTYGQVMGDSFTASNGVRIEQDDMDSFIARAGVRGGFYFPENKGTIYAHASILHDFDGESGFKASKDNVSSRIVDDLGGTWYEFGLGANFNLTPSTYTYVDLQKTTAGEVEEDWRWNAGMRYVW